MYEDRIDLEIYVYLDSRTSAGSATSRQLSIIIIIIIISMPPNKLYKRRVRLDVGKYGFGSRVCNEWNLLTEDVVTAGSLNTFKAKLDHHLRNVRGFV